MSSRTNMITAAPAQEVLADFALQSPFSSPGRHAASLRPLPVDEVGITAVVQGLLIYEHVASPFYDVVIPDARRAESHVRLLERMLDALLTVDDAPLSVARPPHKRLVGICRHFTLMAVAMLRDKGVPARARCGFGAYFNPGYFEDHWVCEYWRAEEQRWALLDPQIDDVWRRKLAITHNMLDVPRDQFLTASAAWMACRKGDLDPAKFGIEFTRMRGLWFIAGNLVRDLAALNKSELLPWDVWGAQPGINATLGHSELAFFDELARLTEAPDEDFDALRARYESDSQLRVPSRVLNVLTQRDEAVLD